MKTLLFLVALLPASALATTKIKNPGQPSLNICQIRAKFLEPTYTKGAVKRDGNTYPTDTVFWKVEVNEVSSAAICPPLGNLNIRVRGAKVGNPADENPISYRVGVAEPRPDTIADMKIEFSEGEDSFTKVKFQEWFLKEVGGE